jgi:hypothetical protein
MVVGAVAASCGLASSAVARQAGAVRRTGPSCSGARGVTSRGTVCPGVIARPGGLIALPHRRPLRARTVVTKDRNSSKSGPFDTVEIEDCLQVRQLPRGDMREEPKSHLDAIRLFLLWGARTRAPSSGRAPPAVEPHACRSPPHATFSSIFFTTTADALASAPPPRLIRRI